MKTKELAKEDPKKKPVEPKKPDVKPENDTKGEGGDQKDWWEHMSPEQEKDYLDEHPNSKYAGKIRQQRDARKVKVKNHNDEAQKTGGQMIFPEDEDQDSRGPKTKKAKNWHGVTDPNHPDFDPEEVDDSGEHPIWKELKDKGLHKDNEGQEKEDSDEGSEIEQPKEGKSGESESDKQPDDAEPTEDSTEKPAAEPGGDKPNAEPKKGLVKKSLVQLHTTAKELVKNQKEFYKQGQDKPNSDARRSVGQVIKDKSKGIWHALKHEGIEMGQAAKAIGKLASGQSIEDHERTAIKSVLTHVAMTAVPLIATHGTSLLAAPIAHVAGELAHHFAVHVIASKIGHALTFASIEEGENDAETQKTIEDMIDKFGDYIASGDIPKEEWDKAFDATKEHLKEGEQEDDPIISPEDGEAKDGGDGNGEDEDDTSLINPDGSPVDPEEGIPRPGDDADADPDDEIRSDEEATDPDSEPLEGEEGDDDEDWAKQDKQPDPDEEDTEESGDDEDEDGDEVGQQDEEASVLAYLNRVELVEAYHPADILDLADSWEDHVRDKYPAAKFRKMGDVLNAYSDGKSFTKVGTFDLSTGQSTFKEVSDRTIDKTVIQGESTEDNINLEDEDNSIGASSQTDADQDAAEKTMNEMFIDPAKGLTMEDSHKGLMTDEATVDQAFVDDDFAPWQDHDYDFGHELPGEPNPREAEDYNTLISGVDPEDETVEHQPKEPFDFKDIDNHFVYDPDQNDVELEVTESSVDEVLDRIAKRKEHDDLEPDDLGRQLDLDLKAVELSGFSIQEKLARLKARRDPLGIEKADIGDAPMDGQAVPEPNPFKAANTTGDDGEQYDDSERQFLPAALAQIEKRLALSSNSLTWIPIGQKGWDGEYGSWYAEFPNSGYGDAKYVIATEGAIGAPFEKTYIDKLNAGRVELHIQYKNRKISWKWLKPTVPIERVKALAEEFVKNFQSI